MARPRSFDEPEVLRRAREVFHDHGYAATSVEQLSQATGLNRSSLYGSFGDKHRLFLDAFAQYSDEAAADIERELAGDEAGALDRLRRHFHHKAADPVTTRRGCLLAKATAELAGEDPEVVRTAKAFYARYEGAITGCIAQAQAAGDLRDDLPAADAGLMVLAALRGMESLGRAQQPKRVLQRIVDTTIAALMTPGSRQLHTVET